jgi:hypothetical protein
MEQPRKGASQKGRATGSNNLTVRYNDVLGTCGDQIPDLG